MEGLEILTWGALAVPIVSLVITFCGSVSAKSRAKKMKELRGSRTTFARTAQPSDHMSNRNLFPKAAANPPPDNVVSVRFVGLKKDRKEDNKTGS